jgi:hypothetical protein
MVVIAVVGLPEAPLAAAAEFYARVLPEALAAAGEAGGDVVLHFASADYTHRAWRLAAVQDLARAAAPRRVNGIEGDDTEAIAAALAYLEGAAGITGQVLQLDSQGAGPVLG